MDLIGAGQEWLHFIVRWVHVIAGISWIGNSFYFMWLDATVGLSPVKDKASKPHALGEVWMVHGGGYYCVEKHQMRAGALPNPLHWFKWEATFTWLSGFALMVFVYYVQSSTQMVDPRVANITGDLAVVLSLALMVVVWFAYDFLWQSPIARSTPVALLLSAGIVVGVCYVSTSVFSGKAAFLQVGAIFGTMMVLNVWVRILPAQKKMIALVEAGKDPDIEIGKKAKWRSTHNSYLTLPVLFTMVSNHLPLAYGHSLNWVILILLCILGGLIRHMMIQWNYQKTGLWLLIPSFIILSVIAFLTTSTHALKSSNAVSDGGPVPFSKVHQIIHARCIQCHADHPTDDVFRVTAGGVSFDRKEYIHRFAERIKLRVFTTQTMPILNKTQMTEDERALLARWVDQGAVTD